ncbi:MAG: hypothetical protein AB7R55_17490 [Gemmatimonadales bacterium]
MGPTLAAAQAEGVYVRLLDVRVEPSDAAVWEAAVEGVARAARVSQLEACCAWLLYREGPYRYRVVLFSDGLADLDTPESFAEAFAGTPGEALFRASVQRLQRTRYEVVEDLIHQMVRGWSTVDEMSTASHPKGRLTKYWVRPGADAAFDAAMREYAALLTAVGYPYPVEGFRWRVGSPSVNYVVVFPDAWSGFLGENGIRPTLERHGRAADYDALLMRIAATVSRVEYHDIDYDPALSY